MADTSQSDRDVLETRWRFLASLAIFVIILSGILVGVIIIPVVQGRSNGINPIPRSVELWGFCRARPPCAKNLVTRLRHRFRK